MDRILHTIEKRGVKLSDLEAQTQLFATSEQQLQALSNELMRLELVSASMAEELKNVSKASGRLEGNIEYAVASLKKTYGEDAYAEEQISLSEAEQAIAQGDQILAELEQSYKKTAEEYETCNKEQGYMIELYKDVKRIVDTNDINVENGKLLEAGKEELRQAFETSLLRYDRSRKNLRWQKRSAEMSSYLKTTTMQRRYLKACYRSFPISIWKRKEWKRESKIWLRSRRISAVSVYSVVWM